MTAGYHEECSRCGGVYPEGEEHTDEECADYLLASRRAERVAHAHHEATAFWRGVCAERASVDDQGAEYWSDPGDLRKWAGGAS